MSRQPAASAATMVLAAAFAVLFIGGGARFAIGLHLDHRATIEDLRTMGVPV